MVASATKSLFQKSVAIYVVVLSEAKNPAV